MKLTLNALPPDIDEYDHLSYYYDSHYDGGIIEVEIPVGVEKAINPKDQDFKNYKNRLKYETESGSHRGYCDDSYYKEYKKRRIIEEKNNELEKRKRAKFWKYIDKCREYGVSTMNTKVNKISDDNYLELYKNKCNFVSDPIMSGKIIELKETIKILNDNILKLKESKATQAAAIDTLTKKNNSLEKEIEELHNIQEAKDKYEDLKTENYTLARIIEQRKEEIDKLDNKLRFMHNEVKTNKTIHELECENARLRQKILTSGMTDVSYIPERGEKLRELQFKVDWLIAENVDLGNVCNKLIDTHTDYVLKNMYTNLWNENNENKHRVFELNHIIYDNDAKTRKLKSEYVNLSKKIAESKTELESIECRIREAKERRNKVGYFTMKEISEIIGVGVDISESNVYYTIDEIAALIDKEIKE